MLRYLASNNSPHGWSLGLKGPVGRKAVPSLHWVFQPLTTTSPSWQVGGDWPGHCPSAPGFQLSSSFLCWNQHKALSAAPPSRPTAASPKLPLSPSSVIRVHTGLAGNPPDPTFTDNNQVVHSFCSWESCCYLPFCLFATSSQDTLTLPGWSCLFCHHVTMSALRGEDSTSWVFILHVPSLVCLQEVLPGLAVDDKSLAPFHKVVPGKGLTLTGCVLLLSWLRVSASTANTLSWCHLAMVLICNHMNLRSTWNMWAGWDVTALQPVSARSGVIIGEENGQNWKKMSDKTVMMMLRETHRVATRHSSAHEPTNQRQAELKHWTLRQHCHWEEH